MILILLLFLFFTNALHHRGDGIDMKARIMYPNGTMSSWRSFYNHQSPSFLSSSHGVLRIEGEPIALYTPQDTIKAMFKFDHGRFFTPWLELKRQQIVAQQIDFVFQYLHGKIVKVDEVVQCKMKRIFFKKIILC